MTSPLVSSSVLGENVGLLNLLIISDIHNRSEYFSDIQKILERNHIKIDIVLCPVDIVNIKTKEQYQSEELQLESLRNVHEMARKMLSFAPKVFLIPGNHDPDALFNNEFSSSLENIKGVSLIHNSIVQLCDGLMIAGFGGSVPSFHVSPPEKAGTQAWKGYPLSSDDLYGKELESLISSLKKDSKNQLIFMTHNGPFACDTTFYKKVDIHSPGITTGSESLRAFLEVDEFQDKCHLFRGGSSLVGNIPIINPDKFNLIESEKNG